MFDNSTVFSDIIYDPYVGFRQQRLKVVGWKTANWNGDYYAPGFVFDSAEVNCGMKLCRIIKGYFLQSISNTITCSRN